MKTIDAFCVGVLAALGALLVFLVAAAALKCLGFIP